MTPDIKTWRTWPDEHSDCLKYWLAKGLSYAQAAHKINVRFGTGYTRNACISRGRRLGAKPAAKPRGQRISKQIFHQRTAAKRKEKRWAENPSLAERAKKIERNREMRAIRAKCDEAGTPRTSPVYRKHLPKLPEMTRSELRAMLTEAVQNTADMGIT